MSPIVFGRFETVATAEDAARALYARGFSVWDVSILSAAPEARDAVDCESTGNEDPGSELEQFANQRRANHD